MDYDLEKVRIVFFSDQNLTVNLPPHCAGIQSLSRTRPHPGDGLPPRTHGRQQESAGADYRAVGGCWEGEFFLTLIHSN